MSGAGISQPGQLEAAPTSYQGATDMGVALREVWLVSRFDEDAVPEPVVQDGVPAV